MLDNWPHRQTRRLDLLYVVPGDSAQNGPQPNSSQIDLELTSRGREQLARAAASIRQARGLRRPLAVMLLRSFPLTAYRQTTFLLSSELGIPMWPDGNTGEGAGEAELATYRHLSTPTLIVPITATGMSRLLRGLDPRLYDPAWPHTPSGSVWHIRITCSLNGPPIERSRQFIRRVA